MTPQFSPLFFSSHADLCEAAASTALADAQAGKEHASQIAALSQQKDDAAQARLARLNTGAAIIAEQVDSLREQDAREFTALAERALLEDVDLDAESRTSAHRRNLLGQLRNIVEHAHAIILPRERLAALLMRAASLTARASLGSWCALEAGVARYEAAKPNTLHLTDPDGRADVKERRALVAAAQREIAHLPLDPARIAAVATAGGRLVQDFRQHRVMEPFPAPRGE